MKVLREGRLAIIVLERGDRLDNFVKTIHELRKKEKKDLVLYVVEKRYSCTWIDPENCIASFGSEEWSLFLCKRYGFCLCEDDAWRVIRNKEYDKCYTVDIDPLWWMVADVKSEPIYYTFDDHGRTTAVRIKCYRE